MNLSARDGKSQRNRLATELGDAFSNVGFAVIEGHDIPAEWMEESYQISRAFFDLPLATKRYYETPTRFTGYIPINSETARGATVPDYKEIFDIRRPLHRKHPRFGTSGYEANVWPTRHVSNFRNIALRMWRAQDQLGGRLLGLLETYLGYPRGTLLEFTRDGESLGRMIHYPARDEHVLGERSAEHEDSSVLSLLRAATGPGLEVLAQTASGHVWMPVEETPRSIVANIGDTLQAYTRGRLRSTTHRVGPGDRGARYADPFFVQANPDADVNPPGLEGDTTYPKAGVLLRQMLSRTGMYMSVRSTVPNCS